MRLATALAVVTALAAAPAQAAVLPGQTLDGPSADILSLGDVSLAADGTGAVAYLKTAGGQEQAFVVRRSGGAWGPPVNVSNAAQGNTDVEVEASNGGRLLVVYQTEGNDLKAKVSPGTGQPFGAEIPLDTGINGFSSDANDAGVGYVVALKGTDVVGQRVTGNTAAPLGAAIATAGTNSRVVAVDGAGNAVVAYDLDDGGNTEIVARRLTGTTVGPAVEATVPTLLGRPRVGMASNVSVASDLAGNAWVSFREQFNYPTLLNQNRNRPLVRRLAGNTFGSALLVDPGPTPPGEMTDAEFIRLAVAPNGANALASGFIQDASVGGKPAPFGASLTPGAASPFSLDSLSDGVITSGNGIVNGGSGFIAYSFQPGAAADYVLRARLRAGTGAFGAPIPVSNPALGNVDGAVSPFTAADASKTGVVAYKQGAAATTRVLAATLDIPQPAAGGGGGDTTDPSISRFSLSRSTFRKGTKLPKLSAVKTGTTIRFRLSEAATVRLTFEKAAKGRRVGRSCRKPSRRNRTRKACRRYVRVKTVLTAKGKAGANKLSFQGRLTRRRSLKTGRYRFSLRATDVSKNVSKRTAKKRFRLLAAAKKRKAKR